MNHIKSTHMVWGELGYQKKEVGKDGNGKEVKERCSGNRNADDLCDHRFFERKHISPVQALR